MSINDNIIQEMNIILQCYGHIEKVGEHGQNSGFEKDGKEVKGKGKGKIVRA
jgi:hypothetical protein